jgi:hypothetical protein
MTDNLPAVAGNGGALATQGGNPFLQAADEMGASSGALYLKFNGNDGLYTFGKDQEGLDKGTRAAINPQEFKRGWICWKDGEVVDEIMVRVVEGKPPAEDTLEDHGPYEDDKDGWSMQSSFQLRSIEDGTEFLFKTSSKSGVIAVANMFLEYGKKHPLHPGELAIIELGNTGFDVKDKKTGKKLGKKFAPVFKIVDWEDEAELIAKFDAAAAEDEEDEADEPPDNTGGRRNRSFA